MRMSAPARRIASRLSSVTARSSIQPWAAAAYSEPLDLDVAEADRIIVAGKAKVPAGPVLARMRMVGHELRHRRHIGVGDHGAVQFHGDLRAFHGDLLKIPFANRPQITALRGHQSVNRTA